MLSWKKWYIMFKSTFWKLKFVSFNAKFQFLVFFFGIFTSMTYIFFFNINDLIFHVIELFTLICIGLYVLFKYLDIILSS